MTRAAAAVVYQSGLQYGNCAAAAAAAQVPDKHCTGAGFHVLFCLL
jgi:hypothetical protein